VLTDRIISRDARALTQRASLQLGYWQGFCDDEYQVLESRTLGANRPLIVAVQDAAGCAEAVHASSA
jgi:hypothetical protein